MRRFFPGYYRPTAEQFMELWQQCIFVLDTNVLLNFYRYSPQTSNHLLEILRSVAERLWLPHQVALEYQENRLSEIVNQEKTYDRVTKILEKTQNELNTLLLPRGHLSIDVDALLRGIQTAFSEVKNELDNQQRLHPNLFDDDRIGEELIALFGERVGGPFTQERLNEIFKQGEIRYAQQVPPGYKDSSKKGVKRYGALMIDEKYGDLVLWHQIIDKAKESRKQILFVTDDTKDDWWWILEGRTIGPRPELVLEMQDKANVLFYMYKPDKFIEYARNYLDVQVAQEVMDEVRDVTESRSDWKDEIVSALKTLGGEARLPEIYELIRETTSRKLPTSWQDIIRYTLYIHSLDSSSYRGGEDIFRRVGRGYWGLKDVQGKDDQDNEDDTIDGRE